MYMIDWCHCFQVIYVEGESDDIVVLNPRWLCSDVIGQLFSQENLSVSRPTGCFSTEDFQMVLVEMEAGQVLTVLEALGLCTRCEVEGEVEYEIPSLNFVETLHGLWERDVTRYGNAVYNGVRLQHPHSVSSQLIHIFPRIQVALRKNALAHASPDSDLYQWHQGSKLCFGPLECLVTLDENAVEIKARSPRENCSALYFFLDDVVSLIESAISDCCPGLFVQKHVLSPTHLGEHRDVVHAYTPRDLLTLQHAGRDTVTLDERRSESLSELLCSGAEDVTACMSLGLDLHVSHLSIHSRRQLSALLDPPDPMGRDWCLLALAFGLGDTLPVLDGSTESYTQSKTDRALEEWSREPDCSIRKLLSKLSELGREDTVEVILSTGPLCRVYHDDMVPAAEHEEDDIEGAAAAMEPSSNSDNTLSSVSRWQWRAHAARS